MFDSSRKTLRNLMRPLACLAAASPAHVFAAGGDTVMLDYLATDSTIIAVFAFAIGLLIGFLIRFVQMRNEISRQTLVLEKSERHIRLMGDNLPNATVFQLFCTNGNNFAFNYLSKGYERILGVDRDRVVQDAKLAFDHIYEDDIPILQKAHKQAMESLTPVDLEIRALDLSGGLKWLRVSAVPHREKNALVWDGFVQDVSNNKNIEDSLVEEKRNFQNLFETIDDFLLVFDMNGNMLHTNPSVERRLKYSQDELGSMSFFELYPEEFRAEAYQVVALMQAEQTTSCGLPLQMKTGDTIPVEMNVFQGSWKTRKAIFGVARDIARHRQTETALRESQQMLQLIMNTIPMSVFWKDQDSVYLGCNKAFMKEFGLDSADDVVGKTPFDLFDKEVAPSVIARDQQVITTNQPMYNYMLSHTTHNGNVGWREVSKIPLRNEENPAVGILGVWRDVTEQNQAEERLKRTLEDMERFNQLMRGRERRTLELKAEINCLLNELGRQIKYQTSTDGPS
jgi:PAS domain S-box-containing protein